jgi:hypothetical protein
VTIEKIDIALLVEDEDLYPRHNVLKDAVKLNAAHGRKLDQQDRTRSVLLLKRRNVPEKQIAMVLHTTQERVQQLSLRFALVKNNGSSEPMPVKPILFRKPDQEPRTLTAEQYEVARGSSGLRTSQTLAQLHNELEVGLWDLTDRNLCERALRLAELIFERVPHIEEDAATA